MRLDERMTNVDACKWTTHAVASAPYVTDAGFMRQYGCEYVVHGDDITTDANGEDCYKGVKDLGLFVVVKRTPNISTTDLVGRMLLMSKAHHFPAVTGAWAAHPLFSEATALQRFRDYASDVTGLSAGAGVFWNSSGDVVDISSANTAPVDTVVLPSPAVVRLLAAGIFYVDGGFDLFHPGHIEALRVVWEQAQAAGAAVVVGLHDDKSVNTHKGLNYPIMNLFERSLCVLQCRFVDAVVIGAPYYPTLAFLHRLPGPVKAVFHGPTAVEAGVYDAVGPLFRDIGAHKFDHMNTEFIVNRVLSNKAAYEERQRRKGWKAETEAKLRQDELNGA